MTLFHARSNNGKEALIFRKRILSLFLTLLAFQFILVENLCSATPQLFHSGRSSMISENRGDWSAGEGDSLIDLAGVWKLDKGLSDLQKNIDAPFEWIGTEDTIVIQREFFLSGKMRKRNWRLAIDGVSNSVKITINNANLDSRQGENNSFQIELPSRLLKFYPEKNDITIAINRELKYSGSPPLKGSIYAPEIYGGIFRGVYLIGSPQVYIERVNINRKSLEELAVSESGSGNLKVDLIFKISDDYLSEPDNRTGSFRIFLLDNEENEVFSSRKYPVELSSGESIRTSVNIPVSNLQKWIIRKNPYQYTIKAELNTPVGDHALGSKFGLIHIDTGKEGLRINGKPKRLKCLNYVNSDIEYGREIPSSILKMDIKQIKDLGVDAIRVFSSSASPQLLNLCEEYGLLVFEELPVFQVPDKILSDSKFIESAVNQIRTMINRDARYTCLAGWGVGTEINPPNRFNRNYYETLARIIDNLDDRPVYAAVPYQNRVNAAPLDFVMLELTEYSKISTEDIPEFFNSDRPIILSGIRRYIQPGNMRGWADPVSESAQANYILTFLKKIKAVTWIDGFVIGDYADWRGQMPSITGPFKGRSKIYSTGLVNSKRQPRLAYRRVQEYWKSGSAPPIPRGAGKTDDSFIIIVFSLVFIIILIISTRQNNIFRFNLVRTFTTPRSFFQSISDSRYFQTGNTVLLAILISGGFGLIGASWIYAQRDSYSVDWAVNYLSGSAGLVNWLSILFWQQLRAFLFFWLLTFILIWIGTFQSTLISSLYRRFSLTQSLDYIVWSAVPMLGLLPLGLVSSRLYLFTLGWIVNGLTIFLIIWSLLRLYWVYRHYIHKPVSMVLFLWIAPPVFVLLLLTVILEYSRSIFKYWRFLFETIG